MFTLKFQDLIPPPRRAERTLLPAGLAALLGLLLAVQFVLSSGVALPDAELGRPLRLRPLVVTLPVADPDISARPLFAPDRREASIEGVGDKTAPFEGARAVGMITANGAVRIFLQSPDGSVAAIGPGGFYKGWRLDRIDGSRLTVSRGDERLTIAITASAPPQPASAADTPPEAQP